nr:transposase [Streptomyces spiramenti]
MSAASFHWGAPTAPAGCVARLPTGPCRSGAHTSRQCSQCGHIDRKHRIDRARFACRACGALVHADDNASLDIARRGETVWTAGRE